MRFKISEKSLYAQLIRAPFWISFVIAASLALFARWLLPVQYAHFAWPIAFPFFVTGAISGWKTWQRPSEAKLTATLETLSAMSWRDFSAALERAWTRDGYSVTRAEGAVDFKLSKAGRTTLVFCKRWKAASHGPAPLNDLYEARKQQLAQEAIYVSIGQMSDKALHFASEHKITLMQGSELTQLLRLPKSALKKAA